jgi:16S rRNA (guanine527-N7)-methyltransferase
VSRTTLAVKLEKHLRHLGLPSDKDRIELMVRLDHILGAWSRSINLIGFKSQDERIDTYFVEAICALKALPKSGRAVDIGSGGGTPALPLAISHPELRWILLEPGNKKAIFLEEAVTSLGLGNVEVRRERYEDFQPSRPIDLVTTRGVLVNDTLLGASARWLKAGGWLYLWTSRRRAEEILSLTPHAWKKQSGESLSPKHRSYLLILERLRRSA